MAVLIIRIREDGTKGHGSYEYKNEITLNDFKLMALLFSDLERYGTNIEKVYREWKKKKQEEFPF